MIENELTPLGGFHHHRLTGPTVRAVGRRRPGIHRAVIGERQRRRIAGREGFLLGFVEFGLRCRVVLLDVIVDVLAERILGVGQLDAVLRALGPGDRWHHRREIQFEVLGELRLIIWVVPHALSFGVGLHQCELFVGASGQPQILDGLFVDREHRCGGTEFGAHIAQRCAVGQRYLGHALAVELDELADHAVLTEHIRDGQHDVGGGDARLDLAGQLEAHDAGDQHRDRLAQHGGLGLDTADAPAQHAQSVDHGGVAVGAHTGVRVCNLDLFPASFARPTADHGHPCQVLDVDLMHDSGSRRHHLEVIEGALAPAQELIALTVALVLQRNVALEGVRATEEVEDHRVVDDQLGGSQWIHLLGIATECGDGLAHGRQVNDAGHPGEVLHDHPGRGELNLGVRLGSGIPVGDRADVVGGDIGAVLGPEQVLGEHLQAVGEFLGAGHCIEAINLVAFVPDGQGVSSLERVQG